MGALIIRKTIVAYTRCFASSVLLVVKLPNRVGYNEAAAVIGDGLRAYTALHYQGRLCAGDTILIIDGALHWANITIQLAHSWGAKVCPADQLQLSTSFSKMMPESATIREVFSTTSIEQLNPC